VKTVFTKEIKTTIIPDNNRQGQGTMGLEIRTEEKHARKLSEKGYKKKLISIN